MKEFERHRALMGAGDYMHRIRGKDSARLSTLAALALVGLALSGCSDSRDVSSPAGPQSRTPSFLVAGSVTVTLISNDPSLTNPGAITTDGVNLYAGNGTAILSVPIGGGAATTLYAGATPCCVIGLTRIGTDLFWIDPNGDPDATAIFRGSTSGGAVTKIYSGFATGQPIVDGVGITTDGTKLYTTDDVQGRVHSLNPDGSAITFLGSRYGGFFFGEHFNTLVESGGILYITDDGSQPSFSPPLVTSIPKAGGSFTTLHSGAPFVHPVAIAVGNGTVFVADQGANTIWSLPITGGTPTALVSGAPFVNLANNGLIFFNNALYVTDNGNVGSTDGPGAIYRVSDQVQPPVANAGGPYTGNEGAPVTFNGAIFDPSGHYLTDTFSWNFGDGSALGTGAAPSHTYLDNGTYTVTLTVSNGTSSSAPSTTTATIANVAPTVGAITAPAAPVPVNTTITASASFTDPGTLDTHTALFNWGDGTSSPATVTEASGSGSASGSHVYSTAGVYTITLTVTDKDGGTGQSVFEFVVVFDPAAGFVTGGGWVNSPAGAYAPDVSLSGKATFGFVSRYQKGATVPSGNTQFQFQAGNLNFKSTSYDWLVIAGAQAKYKGSGTINGAGDFGFLLSAVDGEVSGGGGTDKFRIKIWDKVTGGVIYDNQMGATDDAGATTVIGGGDIVIHN